MAKIRQRRASVPRQRSARPTVIRDVFANGMAIVVVPCAHLAQAHVATYFGVGSRHETPHTNGMTHALEHMLFRGTASHRDATSLNRAAEAFGGFLEGATYRDHLYIGTGCHPSAAGAAVQILGELAATPRYQGMEVERAILREELLETIDLDGRMIDLDNLAHRAVFGKHPLGMPIEGTLGNLESFDLAALESHRQRYLVGTNAVAVVAGPVQPDRLQRQLERAFAGLAAGAPPTVATPPPAATEPVLRYVRDASSQVDVRISFRGVPVQDPGFPALTMLGRVLGDGLASRMNAELVDRQGLAYSLHAGMTRYADCGLFDFEIAVAPDRAAKAVHALLEFAGGAASFRFTPQELDRVRRRYRYSTEFRGDSVADLAAWHGSAALFGIEGHLDRLGRRIATVGPTDIRAAARRLFRREGMVLTAVGELARGEWGRIRRHVEGWQVT